MTAHNVHAPSRRIQRGRKDDLDKYIDCRKKRDPGFKENCENGYHELKASVLLWQAQRRKTTGYDEI
jgi:hypothetical protein